ncbi:MAG: leucine-rich repeat domain-containing protein [Cytophagia bacterium]|nr:leucine-rich repeat domain-containing protein [Cytophagia bacterium]
MGKIEEALKKNGSLVTQLWLETDEECKEAFTDVANGVNKIERLNFTPQSEELKKFPEAFKNIEIGELIIEDLPLEELVGTHFKKLTINKMREGKVFSFLCKNFPKLESLYLWRPEGELHIPDEVENLQELKSLSLIRANLKTVSPKIGKLKKLTSLTLSELELSEVPIQFTLIENLEELFIKEMPVKDFPLEMKNWTRLKRVVLNELFKEKITHQAEQSHEDFADNLQVLTYKTAKYYPLPSAFGELKDLEHFDASFCRLEDVNALAGLSKLKTIELTSTYISDLSGLSQLPRLEELLISNANRLESIKGIENLKSLQKLELKNLEKAHSLDSLASLQNLIHLNLFGWRLDNKITKHQDALKPLANLKNLEYLNLKWGSFDEKKDQMKKTLQPLLGCKNLRELVSEKISQKEWEVMKN